MVIIYSRAGRNIYSEWKKSFFYELQCARVCLCFLES